MGRIYAGILGPLAFVTVMARSLIERGAAGSTLQTATVCLLAFAILGYIAGQIADLVVLDSVRVRFESEMRSQAETDTGQVPTHPANHS